MRKTAIAGSVIIAAAATTLALSGTAGAHSNAVSVKADCPTAHQPDYLVTYKVVNQYNLAEVALATAWSVEPGSTAPSPISQPIVANGSATFTQTFPAAYGGLHVSVSFVGTWSDKFTMLVLAQTDLPTDCVPVTPPTTVPPPTTTTVPPVTTGTSPVSPGVPPPTTPTIISGTIPPFTGPLGTSPPPTSPPPVVVTPATPSAPVNAPAPANPGQLPDIAPANAQGETNGDG